MSGGKLPEGWVETQLGNIIELKYGKSLAAQTRDGFGFPVYGSNGVVGKHSIPLINKSGLIVGRKGSYGVVNKSVGPFFPIDTTYYIDDFYNQPLEFLFYYLSFLPLTKLNRSTAIPGLNRDDAYDLNIALPPLAEQKIIAEKLDTLLAQVDSTKARLEQIPKILKRFRQAVMHLATTGELTSEYRNNFPSKLIQEVASIIEKERIEKKIKYSKLSKEPYPAKIPFPIPKNWQWYRLGHISLKITDGAHNTPKVLSEGYPYIMAKDLTKGKLDFSEKRFISEKDHRELYLKCIPEVGDLLVVNIGAGTGNNVLIDSDIEFSFKNIAIIKKSRLIIPTYLKIFFDSQKNRIFNEQTKGGAQPFLSLSVLNDIPFALPPLPEQHEIVRRVEQLFAYADTIEKQVNSALTRVNNLTQSILAKAFRGELTAQWRADNPDLISGENSAAALLEKIKAERAASGGKKTSRKKA
ncbi:restriction endonuclease subunit S [Citrobacter arsenatis]|uniref:restriction endonuclease subunit S n=1 Tax=Citrobacter arsenatis TaxID=2546350 RepID=UPI003D7F5DE0